MAKVKQVLTLIISISFILLLNHKIEDVPPLGKLLNPYSGFWQNAEGFDHFRNKNIKIDGAKDEVRIIWDENLVPHIYAQNDHDLYLAQGYVTAQLRLWQMEFQIYFASGRLCELVGKKALQLDEFQRRIGMTWAAEKTMESVKDDEASWTAIQAYSDGVNAYINSLDPGDYPLEYKILDYSPEPWTPFKTALFLKYMAWDLTEDKDDFAKTELLNRFGYDLFQSIFPSDHEDIEPIIPEGTLFEFDTLEIPKPPLNYRNPVLPVGYNAPVKPDPDNGSNNWAVHGSRTRSGRPILANDPHLNQRLPSIWMLIHMNAPGTNSYGASFPGAPGVILGFNEHVSWGSTNVGPDIMDWYKIEFKDESMEEYLYDGEWKKTEFRTETIKIKGEEAKEISIPITHLGPIAYLGKGGETVPSLPRYKGVAPFGFALRWTAHDPSNEIRTFLKLNRAKNYDDCVDAISSFICPSQNFVFATTEGDIGLWVIGKLPLKWKDQGKFLLDGKDKSHAWETRIPYLQNPHVKNPPRGFVSSANQHSTDSTYPYYIQWDFDPYMRGRRINQVLEQSKGVTASDMMALQLDSRNLFADKVLKAMLSKVIQDNLTDKEKEAFEIVSSWNRIMGPEEVGASIFVFWWEYMERKIWDDDLETESGNVYPDVLVTAEMIMDSLESSWYDDKTTDERTETSRYILTIAFKMAVKELGNEFGEDPGEWIWMDVNNPSVPHVAEIPGMGIYGLPIGGGKHVINKQKHKHGPSWRFVAEMKDEPEAYGAIPGGQSGNPGSRFYSNFMENWSTGDLVPLNLLSYDQQTKEDNLAVWTISKAK